MIHSARPTVSPVANIVFWFFVFLDLKSGEYIRTTCAKTMIPTGRDCVLAEWINKSSELKVTHIAGHKLVLGANTDGRMDGKTYVRN